MSDLTWQQLKNALALQSEIKLFETTHNNN